MLNTCRNMTPYSLQGTRSHISHNVREVECCHWILECKVLTHVIPCRIKPKPECGLDRHCFCPVEWYWQVEVPIFRRTYV